MAERNTHRSEPGDERSALPESDGGKRSRLAQLFERFEEHGQYWITRNVGTKTFYVQWYDADSRQTRRASLKTKSSSEATKKVEKLIANDVTGDPREALAKKPMEFVGQALEYYRTEYVAELRSKDAAESAIDNFLLPRLGSRRIASFRKKDSLDFAKQLEKEGHANSYVSRILSILRSAFNRAEDDDKIPRAPKVPEVRREAEKDAEPLRGRQLTIPELAHLFDCVADLHVLKFLNAEVNSAARPEAILEARAEQIEWAHSLFELNPVGRKQTKKFRPFMRIATTWRPWLEPITSGPIVSYAGQPVKSVKKAMQGLVKRSGLKGRINATSIRHTLGRYMENVAHVPEREISLFMGHIPVSKKKSTRRYTPANPYHPKYMINAIAAVEAFVREINMQTKKWDLEKPGVVKPGWTKPQ
jgi:integrase